jgi:hypothetical protein
VAASAPTSPADRITAAQRAHDAEAAKYQRRTLTFAVFTVILSPLAVILLAVQAIVFPEGGRIAVSLIAAELIILVCALSMAFMRIGRAHKHWIEERMRAELLRRESFLLEMRIGPYLGTVEPTEHEIERRLDTLGTAETDPVDCLELEAPGGGSWWEQLERAARGRGGPSAPIPNLEERLASYLSGRVNYQREYFGSQSERHALRARLWENGAKLVLVFAAIVAALHLGTLLSNPGHGAELLHFGLVLVAIALPSIGSAMIGLLSILGSHRLSRAYRYNARALQKLAHECSDLCKRVTAGVEKAEELDYEAKRLVMRTEELLSDDLRQWWLIMKPEAPKPGP